MTFGGSFALMADARGLELMHEACGRVADPPFHRLGNRPMWRSMARVVDMPLLVQQEINCAWCQKLLSDEADPEFTGT